MNKTNPEITPEMEEYHKQRIERHINSVREWIGKGIEKNTNDFLTYPLSLAKAQVLTHDADKDVGGKLWDGYCLIDWHYRENKNGRKFPYSPLMKSSTRTHVSENQHHPEYWDKRYTTNFELFDTGDKRDDVPSTAIEAGDMQLSYVAEMVADWKATADERGNLAWAWYRVAVPYRYKFNEAQIYVIEKMLELFEGPELPT